MCDVKDKHIMKTICLYIKEVMFSQSFVKDDIKTSISLIITLFSSSTYLTIRFGLC